VLGLLLLFLLEEEEVDWRMDWWMGDGSVGGGMGGGGREGGRDVWWDGAVSLLVFWSCFGDLGCWFGIGGKG